MTTAPSMTQLISVVKHYNVQNNKTILMESARHPLNGHAYHKKSNAALEYIVKDAGEAAKAMKDHDSKAESKYLDQVNDATTVLAWRKEHGTPKWYKDKYQINETENLEEIGKVGTALGAAGMAAAALTGANAPAAAQTPNVRPDIFVQYDQASVQKNFEANIQSAMKSAPSAAQQLKNLSKKFNQLTAKQQQLVANLQTGMKVPNDAANMANWIKFTNRNIDLASQM